MARIARNDMPSNEDGPANPIAVYGVWAIVTMVGVIAVIVAIMTGTGDTKVAVHPAPTTASLPAPVPPPTSPAQPSVIIRTDPNLLAETQRLGEQLRLLAVDRDRLAKRVEQLEKTVGDVTAAIPRGASSPPAAAEPPAPVPAAEPPKTETTRAEPLKLEPIKTEPAKPESMKAAPAPAVPNPPLPRARMTGADPAAVDSVGTKTEFGVDLGGDTSIEALRALWTTIRGANTNLVEGLRPLVSVRDGPRPGTVELRLIAGPLNNAANAARLCAALATAGVACQPSAYDGQRLALR